MTERDAGPTDDAGADLAVETRAPAHDWWPIRAIALAFLLAAIWFTVADHVIPKAPDLSPLAAEGYHGDTFLGGRARWDSLLLRSIADDGYRFPTGGRSNPAFSPALPLLMRFGGYVVGDPMLAGVLIGAVAGAIGLYVFYRWCALRMTVTGARMALVTMLVYPYAMYLYGVVYTDAILFAAAVVAFYLLEKDQVFAAALVGAVGTATRAQGAVLGVGLVLRVLEQRGVFARSTGPRESFGSTVRAHVARLRPGDAAVLLSFGGFGAYSFYLWRTFNSPLLFLEAGKLWNNDAGLATILKSGTAEMFADSPHSLRFGLALQMCIFAAAVAITPKVVRTFGWAYGAYSALVLFTVLLGRRDFYGSGRYVLAGFPLFAVAGMLFEKRPVLGQRLAGISVALLAGITTMWVVGQWIS